MKVLLTGSAGFIGRHLLRALSERGADVAGMDLVDGYDCLDYFRTATRRHDLAIHCAAVVGGRATIDGSPLAVATNLALDAWFFRWLELSGTPRAVYFSSSAMYPASLQDGPWPLRESDGRFYKRDAPDATYGLVKLVGEQLARQSKAVVHVFRPFSGYSADQSPDYPFRAFLDRTRRREDPFEIWGDGTQVRDWIHVDDLVEAVLTAVDQDVRGPVNLCTGHGTSFNELAEMMTAGVGYRPSFDHRPSAPTGVQHRLGDPALMEQFYTPKISLEEGVRRALMAS